MSTGDATTTTTTTATAKDATSTLSEEAREVVVSLRQRIARLNTHLLLLRSELDAFKVKCRGCRCRVIPGEACSCCDCDGTASTTASTSSASSKTPESPWPSDAPPPVYSTHPQDPPAMLPAVDIGTLLTAPPDEKECRHPKCTPVFDEAASKGLSVAEVRTRWPRFYGACPECGDNVIAYASTAHFVMGDW